MDIAIMPSSWPPNQIHRTSKSMGPTKSESQSDAILNHSGMIVTCPGVHTYGIS